MEQKNMLQNLYRYEYKGLTLKEIKENPSIFTISETNDLLYIILENISNFSYDAVIPNITINATLNGKEQKIKFYNKYSTPDGIIFDRIEIPYDENNQHDVINYVQWWR